jgi:hypothetical protein
MYNGLMVMSLKDIGNCYFSLETFSILKEKFFNPEYNTDIKHEQLKFDGTPDTIQSV